MIRSDISWKWQKTLGHRVLNYTVTGPVDEEEVVRFYENMLARVRENTFLFIGDYGGEETNVSAPAMEHLIDRTLAHGIHQVSGCIVTSQTGYAAKARLYEALCLSKGLNGHMFVTRELADARQWIREEIGKLRIEGRAEA